MIDLFVGGTLGGWAVEHARSQDVRVVVTHDAQLAARAAARGLAVRAVPPTDGDAMLSVHYPRILPQEALDAYAGDAWNLHPGLLPWGRGMFPVFWALYEGTPAGATLHRMTAGLDRGPIVEQVEVGLRPDDTGLTAHARVQAAERKLFETWLPRLAAGERPEGVAQVGEGSYRSLAEFVALRDSDAPRSDRLERALKFR